MNSIATKSIIADSAQMDIEDALKSNVSAMAGKSLRILAGDLAKVIDNVQGAVVGHGIPILECVLMQVRNGVVRLTGTDMEIAITVEAEAVTSGSWIAAIPAARFRGFSKGVPSTQELTIVRNESSIALSGGRYRATIQIENADDYPSITGGEFPHSFELSTKDLIASIDATAFCASKDLTRTYLRGVHIESRDGGLTFVATDGNILAVHATQDIPGCRDIPALILPTRSVTEIKKIASQATGDVTIDVSESRVRMTCGSITLLSKLIDGTYPEYRRVIPDGSGTPLRFAARDLVSPVKLAGSFSGSSRIPSVKLDISRGGVVIKGTDAPTGDVAAELTDPDASFDGDDVSMTFRATDLVSTLGSLDSEVEMIVQDGQSPVLLRRVTGEGTLYVIMPLRF